MSIKRPMPSIFTTAPSQRKPSTFGSYRAERMQERLQKAITERHTLARAQAAADAPLNDHLRRKGEYVAHKIGQFQQSLADETEKN